MPRQRLANGWYELSDHPGLLNVPQSARGKACAHEIRVRMNRQELDPRLAA
jgi:hypothetical protein